MFLFAFYFAAFTVLSLSSSHFNYRVSWCVRLWLILCGTLCFLDLGDYFLSSVMGIFKLLCLHIRSQHFSLSLLLLEPLNVNMIALDLTPEVFYTVRISFNSFLFFFCSAAVIFSTVFQLTDPFLSIIYSAVESF